MEPKTDQSEALESKPDAKPNAQPEAKDDLKSLPMVGVSQRNAAEIIHTVFTTMKNTMVAGELIKLV